MYSLSMNEKLAITLLHTTQVKQSAAEGAVQCHGVGGIRFPSEMTALLSSSDYPPHPQSGYNLFHNNGFETEISLSELILNRDPVNQNQFAKS